MLEIQTSRNGARLIGSCDEIPLWGPKFQEREAKVFGSLPFLACIFCGRDTSKQGNSNGVIVSDGGGAIVHPEDNEKELHDGGYMGWFPVGSECIKSVPAEFRQKNFYDDKVKGVNHG